MRLRPPYWTLRAAQVGDIRAHVCIENELTIFPPPLGLVSQTLAPSCKSILGVDISENMVARFNTDAQNSPATKDKLKAILWNELDADAKFDVAVVS